MFYRDLHLYPDIPRNVINQIFAREMRPGSNMGTTRAINGAMIVRLNHVDLNALMTYVKAIQRQQVVAYVTLPYHADPELYEIPAPIGSGHPDPLPHPHIIVTAAPRIIVETYWSIVAHSPQPILNEVPATSNTLTIYETSLTIPVAAELSDYLQSNDPTTIIARLPSTQALIDGLTELTAYLNNQTDPLSYENSRLVRNRLLALLVRIPPG